MRHRTCHSPLLVSFQPRSSVPLGSLITSPSSSGLSGCGWFTLVIMFHRVSHSVGGWVFVSSMCSVSVVPKSYPLYFQFSLLERLLCRSVCLWVYVVPSRCCPSLISMSQMAIVSLIALCFWSSSSPSSRWCWLGCSPSWIRLVLISSCSQSGGLYVRNRSPCLFQSWMVLFGRCLIRHLLPLYLSWAVHPMSLKKPVSSNGRLVFGRGG